MLTAERRRGLADGSFGFGVLKSASSFAFDPRVHAMTSRDRSAHTVCPLFCETRYLA